MTEPQKSPQESVVDVGRGISLCYDQIGYAGGPPVVLIAGLGQQKHSYPLEFAIALSRRGFNVIRFDNRDVGCSTHMDFPPPGLVGMLRGGNHPRQYHMGDMARDTVGLLDALGHREADVVGVSMGGIIGQTVAAHYPGHVRTLTSIMSTTGARRIGQPALSTRWRVVMGHPPRTRAEAEARAVKIFRHIGSHGFPFDEQRVRELAGVGWDRDPSPAGFARQIAAIVASGDRTKELGEIVAPTLVIHGDRDRMVHPTGGEATARAIPGARLETITGMGHDLPRAMWPRLVDMIADHINQGARRARSG